MQHLSEPNKILTHSQNGGVVRHLRWLRRLVLLLIVSYADVFYITSAKDNVFIDTGSSSDLFRCIASSSFGAMRNDIFEGNGRIFRIYLVQSSNIAVVAVSQMFNHQ